MSPTTCPTCGGRGWHTAGGNDPMACGRCPAGQAWYEGRENAAMNWWDGMYARKVRLTQPYERDLVWWEASEADPAWVTLEVGEELTCSDDEANYLIEKGIAVEVEK